MSGNYVFPGGRVDQEDGAQEICALTKGITPEEAYSKFGELLSPEESLAHWVAGIRELFEEAGILLAYDQNGNLFQLKNPADRVRFANYRTHLQKGQRTIWQIARDERLLLAVDQLHYYAHWITPEARRERFDTRFFLACLPAGQEPSFDQKETIAEVWLTPREAFEENVKGRIALSPPTLQIMEDLSQFNSAEDVLNSLRGKGIRPILPILKNLGGEVLIFPWDPEYEIFNRGDIPATINHVRPSRAGDHTTRLILRRGIWYPYCLSH